MAEKVSVVIPAFNEEKTIGPLLESLQKVRAGGVIHEIVVVDDGSTDNTSRIASERGARIVRLRNNSGKAFAFFKGALAAKGGGSTVVVTLDADIGGVSKAQVKALLRPLKRPNVSMAIGNVLSDSVELSGQRAIKISALEPLFRQNKKWEMFFGLQKGRPGRRMGYALEEILNYLLTGKRAYANTMFRAQRRAVFNWNKMDQREMTKTDQVIKVRRRLAKRLKRQRMVQRGLRK